MSLTFSTPKATTNFRTLLYGDTGVGKTVVALSARLDPDLCPILVVDIDAGLSSVNWLNEDKERVRVVTLTELEDLKQLINEFTKPAKFQNDGVKGVKTLIIDSVSALRNRTLDLAVERAHKKYPDKYERWRPQIQHYAEATYSIATVVDVLRQMQLNLILTAGVDELRTDAGMIDEARPLMNDRLRQSIYYMMDNVWFLREVNGRYTLQVLPRESSVKIKTRNDKYTERLRQLTREVAPKGKETAYEGRLVISSPYEQTIPYLYNLYKQSVETEENENDKE